VAVKNHAHLGPAHARLDGGAYVKPHHAKAYVNGDIELNGIY
jgi:hypothetical protein